MTINEYFGDWSNVIDLDEVQRLVARLQKESNLCPKANHTFKAFHLCPLNSLRVVILGQDPYPDYVKDAPRATGIAFANASETLEKDYSPSLRIIMESVIDFSVPHKSIIFDPTFEHWERQGVLMLNSALSCTRGKPGSHSLMWRPFVRNLLTNLSSSTAGMVYLLMGSAAQSFEQYINHTSNHVIRCEHPSYCARTGRPLSSEIWKEINAILVNQNGNGIQWYIEQ